MHYAAAKFRPGRGASTSKSGSADTTKAASRAIPTGRRRWMRSLIIRIARGVPKLSSQRRMLTTCDGRSRNLRARRADVSSDARSNQSLRPLDSSRLRQDQLSAAWQTLMWAIEREDGWSTASASQSLVSTSAPHTGRIDDFRRVALHIRDRSGTVGNWLYRKEASNLTQVSEAQLNRNLDEKRKMAHSRPAV